MSEEPDGPERCVAEIQAGVARDGCVTRRSLLLVETALAAFPSSAALWCLRGDLIQLSDDDDLYTLEDAGASYERASVLEPDNLEPFESLGHFYDAVMNDPVRAEPFFRRALELGAGDSARSGLAQVLDQLGQSSSA